MSMIKNALFLVLFYLLTTNAFALEITIDDPLISGKYLSEGDSYSSSFDINSLFASDPEYFAPYDILSGVVKFSFTDNLDNRQLINGWGHSGVNEYSVYFDPQETVEISIGAMSTTKSTIYTKGPMEVVSSYTHAYWVIDGHHDRRYIEDVTCWGFWAGDVCIGVKEDNSYYSNYWVDTSHYAYETRYQHEELDGYYGDIEYSAALDATTMADMSFDGILDYTLTGELGDMFIVSAELTLDIARNQVTDPDAPVPEPSTILLMGAGLAGLAIYRRKVKKESRAGHS